MIDKCKKLKKGMSVQDISSLLGGRIKVGACMSGYYTYKISTNKEVENLPYPLHWGEVTAEGYWINLWFGANNQLDSFCVSYYDATKPGWPWTTILEVSH